MNIEMREGIKRLLEVFEDKGIAILIAPTGYGKTLASLKLLERAIKRGMASGLIHVAPLRSLVRNIYRDKFKGKGYRTGYQSLELIDDRDKSPYYLRELVVTTLDSFIMNLYRVPVAEYVKIFDDRSLGHYYVPLSSIYTSVVVFDEAHIYLGELDESVSVDMVRASIAILAKLNIPFVIESATIHSKLLEEIASTIYKEISRKVNVIYVGSNNIQTEKIRSIREIELDIVEDEEFEKEHMIEWETQLIDEKDIFSVIDRELERIGDRNTSILIIRNTVKKAIKTYKDLQNRYGSVADIILIHSRLSNRDRSKAEDWLFNKATNKIKIIVATQLLEAGVEPPYASVLITDPAPSENMIQRIGRLCREGRKNEICRNEGARIYILKSYDISRDKVDGIYDMKRVEETLKLIEQHINSKHMIDWRITIGYRDYDKRVSFVDILEKIEPTSSKTTPLEQIFKHYLQSDEAFDTLRDVIDSFTMDRLRKGFFREAAILNLAINSGSTIDYLQVDAEWFFKKEREILERGETGCLEYEYDRAKVLGYLYKKNSSYNEIENKVEIIVKRSRNISKSWIKKQEYKKYLSYDEFHKIYEPLYEPWSSRAVSARFHSLLMRRDCYKEGIGLVHDYV